MEAARHPTLSCELCGPIAVTRPQQGSLRRQAVGGAPAGGEGRAAHRNARSPTQGNLLKWARGGGCATWKTDWLSPVVGGSWKWLKVGFMVCKVCFNKAVLKILFTNFIRFPFSSEKCLTWLAVLVQEDFFLFFI